MPTPVTTVDLDRVATILVEARKETYKLSDIAIKIDADPGAGRPDVARLGRDLLHLADTLQLASALVHNEYWVLKGYADSIDGDD